LQWADSGLTGISINTNQDEAVRLLAGLAGTDHQR